MSRNFHRVKSVKCVANHDDSGTGTQPNEVIILEYINSVAGTDRQLVSKASR